MRSLAVLGALATWVVATRVVATWVVAAWIVAAASLAADGNRLAYLDESDPFYPSQSFAKLTTPQWIGEPGVEAVVILSIDDMRGHEKWEAFLRPLLDRLKKIDGRAPVSIMTCQIDPRHPHLQTWLKEGLSLEVHTYDHPCPLLQQDDFAKAKATYDRCVDQMNAVPRSRAVAFRMPCCDSQNTPSPRFYAEIFNRRTPSGGFLEIDSSVFNITTANDPAVPRELVLDDQSREIFRRYLPFKSYVVTIDDYPYPYVIGKLCWEFPCAVPSDWSAQHVNQPDNPGTVADMKRALDAAVAKQGVYTLVFHPHNWIKSEQLVDIVDHAVAKHGGKVKFLNFREAAERITKHLLAGQPLRNAEGADNGVRLLDVNGDGFTDVVIGNRQRQVTRIWSPVEGTWREITFPLVDATAASFGIVHDDGLPSVFDKGGGWHFDGQAWQPDAALAAGLPADRPIKLRDVDGDGRCELIAGAAGQGVHRFVEKQGWQKLPYALPEGTHLADAQGHDAGMRFVDIDQNGSLDVLYSNESGFGAWLFDSPETGWAKKLVAGKPGDAGAIPMIARNGENNGAWIHGHTLWVQNETTDKLPDLVDRKKLDDLLISVPFPGPKSPQQSLAVLHARAGFQVELMAAEPLVADPVALAFGPDGKLWIAEMGDYPRGADGKGKRGGMIRFLEDTDSDGRYDRSTVFLDDLGYPNGVAPWRGGVLVTCAPDIFYAEDTDGDGRADKREVLYTGFQQGNPQHRMNGLKWGMDGWLYGAHGAATGNGVKLVTRNETVNANGRDFRIRPDQGLLDPQSGESQYGRNVDDWGNWFGNSNSEPLYQFALADHYLRRNPHVPGGNGRHHVPEPASVSEIFPRSRTLARFNDLYAANRFTSANSTIIYRDDLLGPAFEGNAFVSEPVHNLVHRQVLHREGLLFFGRRADDERESEFLASADNWFRPCGLTTGPDGALWIADMYRQTIEHPEWIPIAIQKQIDLRAGVGMGRIYRVYPVGKTPRKIPRLDKLSSAELVAALDSPSGWQRDTVQQLLLWRGDQSVVPALERQSADASRPAARAQALWTADLLGLSAPDAIARALKDAHPGVRRQAIEIAEPHLDKWPQLGEVILALGNDADAPLQLQRAFTLGQWRDDRSGGALAELALRYPDVPVMQAAVLSSVHERNLAQVMAQVLDAPEPPGDLLEKLVGLAAKLNNAPALSAALAKIGRPREGKYAAWQWTALAGLLDALADEGGIEKHDPDKAVHQMLDVARAIAASDQSDLNARLLAVRLLCRQPGKRPEDIQALASLLTPQSPGALQAAAVESLARLDTDDVPPALLAGWKSHGPQIRSQILEVLTGRPNGSRALLAAIEEKRVPPGDVDATRRERLTRSGDAAIKSRAEQLLAGAVEANRAQVIEQHAAVLEATGAAQAGAAVFTKRCAVCHKLRGSGYEVGPNLAALTDYSPASLLTAILDPNRAVEAKYLGYIAVTTSGVTHTGMLAHETGNSVTLLGQEGKQQTILRGDLEALQATGKSLMPEGLEKDLDAADLANVIAYLRGSGSPRKVFGANRPRLVTATSDGSLQLYPTTCEIYGPTIVMQYLYKSLSKWESENDRVVWNVELPKPGRYQVLVNYACLDEHAGNTWLLEAGGKQLNGKVIATGSNDNFQQVVGGEIDLPGGAQSITFRSSGPITGSLLQLGGVTLRPVK